eukprot:7380797-Prymnesium_polylepis.1
MKSRRPVGASLPSSSGSGESPWPSTMFIAALIAPTAVYKMQHTTVIASSAGVANSAVCWILRAKIPCFLHSLLPVRSGRSHRHSRTAARGSKFPPCAVACGPHDDASVPEEGVPASRRQTWAFTA